MNPLLTSYSPDNPAIVYAGRIDFEDPKKPRLSSAGAYFAFKLRGGTCILDLETQYYEPSHNYLSVEVDGIYQGRIKIEKGITRYTIAKHLGKGNHLVLICKATESFIGYVQVNAIHCKELLPGVALPDRKIECIGNSITSGAQVGVPGLDCEQGEWHDHNNAYLAYGPQLAKLLDAQWVLSSISGMGLTRNWNNEGPGVPWYYDQLYLDENKNKRWTVDQYSPDLVTVCLGTNDNSEGDGSYDRKPLDSAKFVKGYIAFVNHLLTKYPDVVICLLNSPVFGPEEAARFDGYLKEVAGKINAAPGKTRVYTYTWSKSWHSGCTYHPSAEEQAEMAIELEPFIKKIMQW